MEEDIVYDPTLLMALRKGAGKFCVLAIWVVGSFARGHADSASDLDFVVVIAGHRQYLRYGQWQGRAIEAIYTPRDRFGSSGELLQGARLVWARDADDTAALAASTTRRGPSPGYAAWDLRQGLVLLKHARADVFRFRYLLAHWVHQAAIYILRSSQAAVPTVRRQWEKIAELAPREARILAMILESQNNDTAYALAVQLLDDILQVPLWVPFAEAELEPLELDRAAKYRIQKLDRAESLNIGKFWANHWGSTTVVSRGIVHHPADVTGFAAVDSDGTWLGLVTIRTTSDQWEIISLDSLNPGIGIGGALLDTVEREAHTHGATRLWLITTNDNVHALGFYQRRQWEWVAIHRNAIDLARHLKPEIPHYSGDGIAILHEIELEKRLT